MPGASRSTGPILTPSLDEFLTANRPWLERACRRRGAGETVTDLPLVGEVLGTYRTMLEALAAVEGP